MTGAQFEQIPQPTEQQQQILDLANCNLTNFSLPDGLTNLASLYLWGNPLTNVAFPQGAPALRKFILGVDPLASFELPTGLANLTYLQLEGKNLTNLVLSSDLASLQELYVHNSPVLTTFSVPPTLTNLASLMIQPHW